MELIERFKKRRENRRAVKRFKERRAERRMARFDEDPESWITVNGNHIPLDEEQKPIGGQVRAFGEKTISAVRNVAEKAKDINDKIDREIERREKANEAAGQYHSLNGNAPHDESMEIRGGSNPNVRYPNGYSRPKAQDRTIKDIARKTANLKNEQYRVVDPDGNILLQKKGDSGSVATTVGEKREHVKGNVTIHNHPNFGAAFSPDDLHDFGYGAKEIVVAAPEGTYSLVNDKKDSNWVDMRDALDSFLKEKKLGDFESLDNRDDPLADWNIRKKAMDIVANSPEDKRLNELASTLLKKIDGMKANGASREEIQAVANSEEYKKAEQDRKDRFNREVERIRKEAVQNYRDTVDKWYKENAEKFGFKYAFTPNKRKDSRMDEEPDSWITVNGNHIPLDKDKEPIGGQMKAIGGEHKVVQGKDITKTWERREDKFEYAIEDVINAQGFDGKPRVVDQEEFDKAVKAANDGDGFVAQRTYTAPTKETADEFRKMLYSGDFYVDCSTGGAQYGQGMYCAADYSGEISDGIKEEMYHYGELGKERDFYSKKKRWEVPKEEYDKAVEGLSDKEREVFDAFFGMAKAMEKADRTRKKEDYDEVDRAMEIALQKKDLVDGERKKEIQKLAAGTAKKLKAVADEATVYTETFTLDPSTKIINHDDLIHEFNEYKKKECNEVAREEIRWAVSQEDGLTEEEKEAIEYCFFAYYRGGETEKVPHYESILHEKRQKMKEIHSVARIIANEYEREFPIENEGVYAAMMGYDAINAGGHGESGSYTVILNRTKCIFLRPKDYHGDAEDEPIVFKRNKRGEVEAWRGDKLLGVIHQFGDELLERKDSRMDFKGYILANREALQSVYDKGGMKAVWKAFNADGGPGSGNWGHAGREGERGGSAKGGGLQNRRGSKDEGYSSDAKKVKEHKDAAKSHSLTEDEINKINKYATSNKTSVKIFSDDFPKKLYVPEGSYIEVSKGGTFWVKDKNGNTLTDPNGNKMYITPFEVNDIVGSSARVIYADTGKSFSNQRQSSPFSDRAFSNRRKENAGRITSYDEEQKYRDHCKEKGLDVSIDKLEEIRSESVRNSDFAKNNGTQNCTEEEKNALRTWTSNDYMGINSLLREGEEGFGDKNGADTIDTATEAISKSKIDRDMYLQRRIYSLEDAFGFAGLGEIKVPFFNNITDETIESLNKKLTGAVGLDEGFMACDTSTHARMDNIILDVYAPKGTEAIFLDDISHYRGERETLLQRGTMYRCTGVERNPNNKDGILVHVEVIGQHPKARTGDTFEGKRRV